MKTTLAIILSASLTCNAFLLFLVHQRPSAVPSAATNLPSASGVSQAEYDRVNGLYQKDEDRIAAIKQRVPIVCVIIQDALFEEKYRGVLLNRYLASIDTSKCPMDFQQAWLGYVQEKKENQRQQSATAVKFFASLAAAMLTGGASETITAAAAGAALRTVADAPRPADTAADNLQRVLLKYGFRTQV